MTAALIADRARTAADDSLSDDAYRDGRLHLGWTLLALSQGGIVTTGAPELYGPETGAAYEMGVVLDTDNTVNVEALARALVRSAPWTFARCCGVTECLDEVAILFDFIGPADHRGRDAALDVAIDALLTAYAPVHHG